MERATALVWRSEGKGTGPSYDVGPGVELVSSSLVASAFAHCAILQVYNTSFPKFVPVCLIFNSNTDSFYKIIK